MAKQLKMTDVNKMNKKFEEQERVLLADGQYEIIIQKSFRQTTIQRLLLEYAEIIEQLSKEKVDIHSMQNLLVILNMLIIKYFTNFKVPDNISKMIDACNSLIDAGVFKEIMESFNKEEIEKINKAFDEFTKKLPQMQNLITASVLQNGDNDGDIQES